MDRRKQADVAAVSALLEREDADTVRHVADALERALAQPDGLDERLWGRAPTAEAAVAAAAAERRLAADQRERALAGSLSRDEAAAMLGVTPAAISKQLDAGRLVGIKQGREWRLPAWQFNPDGVLGGLRELVGAFPGGTVALSLWAQRPHPDLDGLTPAQTLARGRTSDVLAAVERIALPS